MELFSLEDQDYGDIFITQSITKGVDNVEVEEDEDNLLFLGNDPEDFQSPQTAT